MINNDGKILEIKGAIIKVIAFFDLFDYVLTDVEIWLMLGIKCQLKEVVEALEKPPYPPFEGGQIESRNGFYFLAGREKNIAERLKRYNFTDRKFKRAMLVAKIFKFIPWIKMMAVGNLLGAHNLKNLSDIDFFIVAEDKRIWLARFFCAGMAKLLGLRPRAGNSRDKICLSFFVSEEALDLRGLMLTSDKTFRLHSPNGTMEPSERDSDGGGKTPLAPLLEGGQIDDIYFTYWLAGLTPLYDVGGAHEKLVKANLWLYASLPNWQPMKPARQRLIKPLVWEFYHDLADLFFGGLEPQFRRWQIKILPPSLKNLMNSDSRVVVNDKIIKLHANDRREEYRGKFEEKIKELNIL